jgi:hypothetical protein
MVEEDLETFWREVRVDPWGPTTREDPNPTAITPGYVWMGLFVDPVIDMEPPDVSRVPVLVREGRRMIFRAEFKSLNPVTVYAIGLWTRHHGGDRLLRRLCVTTNMTSSDTLRLNFEVDDTDPQFGLRRLMKAYGIIP